ncbi:MAG: DUF2239 family protein [Deltaproteobacteria bacterium]|nr:DUF2239 family protein [Deltaproteobacteria bacterium]
MLLGLPRDERPRRRVAREDARFQARGLARGARRRARSRRAPRAHARRGAVVGRGSDAPFRRVTPSTNQFTRVIFTKVKASETYTAFAGDRLVWSGPLPEVLARTKKKVDRNPELTVLVFEDKTGRQVDFDLSGTPEEVVLRARAVEAEPEPERTGPGRPRLGVVAREVTLLPRHWEWLEQQPQGASAALRRLVDEARKREPNKERARLARAAISRFMWVMAGDLPNFEEASRALFAKDTKRFAELVRRWPADIRKHLERLTKECEQLEDSPG